MTDENAPHGPVGEATGGDETTHGGWATGGTDTADGAGTGEESTGGAGAGSADDGPGDELDVRGLPKPRKHPAIFERFESLPVGGSFVLVNDHDPRPLRAELEREQPGSHGWEYLQRDRREVRVRLTRLASTPLPRVLTSDAELVAAQPQDGPNAASSLGAAWKLPMSVRDLDANLIVLPPGGAIDSHAGPELDVLLHVVDGTGALVTELGEVPIAAGDVVWLPRRSRRAFRAGDAGLRYLTVHQRRRGLRITAAPPAG